MTFEVNDLDLRTPMNTEANLGYFMTDDIMVSLGMSDWDNFTVGARYYGVFDDMFVEATTTATGNDTDGSDYAIGAAIGWSNPTYPGPAVPCSTHHHHHGQRHGEAHQRWSR